MTNHARALLFIARQPDCRLRDLAAALDVAERTAFGIVADLAEGGYITRKRVGRRNTYTVNRRKKLRHDLGKKVDVGSLLDVLT